MPSTIVEMPNMNRPEGLTRVSYKAEQENIFQGACRMLPGAALAGIALLAMQACSRPESSNNRPRSSNDDSSVQVHEGGAGYPAPRFLASLLDPTKDDLLRGARVAVRQTHGMGPLGKMEAGQIAHVVLPYSQDEAVWEAIKAAWAERGVDAIAIRAWEITGQSKEEYRSEMEANLLRGSEAWKELGVFDAHYMAFFSPAVQRQLGKPMSAFTRHKNLRAYLEAHPEVEHIFVDPAGGPNWMGVVLGPELVRRFVGNWTYESAINLTNNADEYPSDLWNMVEDKLIAPIEHVAEGTFTDPEGTDLSWQITPEQARKWKRYVALVNNHLFMYPQPIETLRFSGKAAGTANHTGFYPHMTVHLSDHGRVTKVEGGGKTGELFRMLLDHPKLKEVRFPSTPEKGYWYLATDGFATNPKKARDYELLVRGSAELSNLPERERAGVIHLSFSSGAGNYEISLADVQKAVAEGKKFLGPKGADVRDLVHAHKYDIPMGHTAHIHNYFGTLRWKLRDTGEWITLSEKGRLNAFDDAEVRALAARYGDPATIFSYDWIPAIPGINIEGDYQRDYAHDPWSYISREYDQMRAKEYPYFIPGYEMLQGPAARRAGTEP